ncbi:histidinol-phosphate aminotransferase [Buchnera aphidicola (Cinara tujafilina)]|uniref:Histidinol-phosphate aminotransferase n=1 Tax=Buchnera aphidicola (Cinara tujafilina) TaxID=261317 RepID=F7WZ08_9GAMM|nr:histidinol-phosphate transaminase [Buchnera aphidicola]AEH39658.1 histidinol-phosphate aminotransferase [Buchnera aphidicola (Cinara tujafilina)]
MKKLVPNHIRNLIPYQSARCIKSSGHVWLNANELPFINDNIYKFNNNLNRYPEPQPKILLQKYSYFLNISPKNILVTRGSDEGIELLLRTFCVSKIDKIMIFPPTYDMYEVSANIFGIDVIKINSLSNFQLNIAEIQNNLSYVKIIYLCNPNNPTGNLISKKDIYSILNILNGKILLVIDEAYIEFSESSSMAKELYKYSNLVILRTLSKAFGLAGLRCGFILAGTKIIKYLKKVIAPYPIAIPVSDIVSEALSTKNIMFMRNNINKIISYKLWCMNKLKKFLFVEKVFLSSTNFILIKCYSSEKIFKYLEENGIIVRNQSHKLHLKNCLRISIGKKNECDQLINLLSMVEEKHN